MELPTEGIYCIAKASSDKLVEATAYLPYAIDLSKKKAELAIKYIAITPTWKHVRDLFVHVIDLEQGNDSEGLYIHFDEVTESEGDLAIENIRKQLDAHNGAEKNPLLKIIKHKSRQYSVFKLRSNAAVGFSPGLATLFGLKSSEIQLYRSLDKNRDIPITTLDKKLTSTSDIYYLKNNEIASNFFLDNHQDRIIEVLHIPGNATIDVHPNFTYNQMEESILQHLRFTLYNEENLPVLSDHTDLYIICHFRPRP